MNCGIELKQIWDNIKSNEQNKNAIDVFRKTVRAPWYVWHDKSTNKDVNTDSSIYYVTDLHNMMVNRDNYFTDIYPTFPLKGDMDIAHLIPTVQEYMQIRPLSKQLSPTLVIWFKDKQYQNDKYQYHQEHQISTTVTIAMLEKLGAAIMRLSLAPLNVYVKNDNDCRKAIQEVNHLSDAITIHSLDAIGEFSKRSLFEQYRWIGNNLPADTVHYGGRSGHLEPMPFLGHRVIYYEEFHNAETKRIFDSLCSIQKNGEKIYIRYLDMLQTKDGAKKLLHDLEKVNTMENLMGIEARLDETTKEWVKETIADNLFQDLLYFLYPEMTLYAL